MPKYRIAKFYKGKYGYPERYDYYELQQWSDVYKYWFMVTTGFLGLEYLQGYCTINKINYSTIPHVYIEKENK